MNKEFTNILYKVKEKFTDDSELIYTFYETVKEARDELDTYINQLSKGDKTCLKMLELHFSPASIFQEHAMQNGWSKEYMQLAEKFDAILAKHKPPKHTLTPANQFFVSLWRHLRAIWSSASKSFSSFLRS